MNWERAKTFLIILFLGINIFLVLFMFNSVKTSMSITSSVIDDTVTVLNSNGIEIDKDIIPQTINNIGSFDVVAKNVDVIHTAKKQITESNIKDEIKKALYELNIKDYNIYNCGDLVYNITQSIKGYPIFDSFITAVSDGNTLTLKGVWYEPQSMPEIRGLADGEMVYVTSVLIDFVHNPDRNISTDNKITSVDLGYCVPMYDSGVEHKSMPSVPCYLIVTEGGGRFKYEANNGNYVK